MKELSARAKRALAILSAGGEYVCRLERNYHGREHFVYRIVKAGHVVPGYSLAVFYEIREFLVLSSSTSVSTYYKYNGGA